MTDLTPEREQEIRVRQEWSEDYDVIADLLAALDAERARADGTISRESALALIEDTKRWQQAYERECDRNRNLRFVLDDLYGNTGDDEDCDCFICSTIRDAVKADDAAALAVLEEPPA